MIDITISKALRDNEPGDARSLLDELDPNGLTDPAELNRLNGNYVWSYCQSDGWGYIEL